MWDISLLYKIQCIGFYSGDQWENWYFIPFHCHEILTMSLSKEIPVFHKLLIDILDFSSHFGDLSPIEEFRGPKTPSYRQALRNLLFGLSKGTSLQESANEVVVRVLLKHPTETRDLKCPRDLANDVINIYKDARLHH